jgi:23S rRNA U2552 (ribose-2'-O)-methylase RlmE/FtsJ
MQDLPVFEFGGAPNVTMGERVLTKAVQRDLEGTEFIDVFNSASVGYDLGSGPGESAAALLQLCPNLKELHAVDLANAVSSPETRQIIGEILKTHNNTRINQFLIDAAQGKLKKADVIMMASIPTHRFGAPDYVNLGRSIQKGGVLIELADTNLQPNLMAPHFNLNKSISSSRNYWVRK